MSTQSAIRHMIGSASRAIFISAIILCASIPSMLAPVMTQSASLERRAVAPNAATPMLRTNNVATTPSANYYGWSGYAATSTRPFYQVRSVYVQPTTTCTTPGAWDVMWVGFDGVDDLNGITSNTVEQAGTAAQCGTGRPTLSYYAWWEMDSSPTSKIMTMPLTIHPGDKIEDVVTYTASSKLYNLTVEDLTTAKQYTKTTACAAGAICARDSAEWIVERPTFLGSGSYAPLADFKSIRMTTNQAAVTTTTNAKTKVVTPVLQAASVYSPTALTMVDYPDGANMLANVGPLDTNGVAFTDSWVAAQ